MGWIGVGLVLLIVALIVLSILGVVSIGFLGVLHDLFLEDVLIER
jgi:hypothetical protein